MYDPSLPPSDRRHHDFIRAPSANRSTSMITPLGLTLSIYGRVDNPPHHSPENDDFIFSTPSSPSSISLSLLSMTCCHSISAVPAVPHICRHTFLPPSPPAFLFFYPCHTVSITPLFPSSPRVLYIPRHISFHNPCTLAQHFSPTVIFSTLLSLFHASFSDLLFLLQAALIWSL